MAHIPQNFRCCAGIHATEGIVQHQVVNNMPLGRSVKECLRVIDALQHFEQHGEVCPAGWNKGKPGMVASTEGVAAYLAKNAKKL